MMLLLYSTLAVYCGETRDSPREVQMKQTSRYVFMGYNSRGFQLEGCW
jgi:hypothetical protein